MPNVTFDFFNVEVKITFCFNDFLLLIQGYLVVGRKNYIGNVGDFSTYREKRINLAVVFIDLHKAFDRVPREVLWGF